MILHNSVLIVLSLIALSVSGHLLLGRGERATEGKIVSALLSFMLLMSYATLQAKRDSLLPLNRVNLNDPKLEASTLAERIEIAPEIAERILAYRNRLPGATFRSAGQIPSLGRATRAEAERIVRWEKEKRWGLLNQIIRTGKIPSESKSSEESANDAVADPNAPEESDAEIESSLSPPVIGKGLYPSLDLETRAAEALPNPPFTLSGSSRSALAVALGNSGVAERILQCRTLERREPRYLSEVLSLPLDKIILREPSAATVTFEMTMISLLALFLIGHLYLRIALPQSDPLLWPIFSGLSIFGVLMLFAVSQPLMARANLWPFVGALPEYAGQGIYVAAAMLSLPFARRILDLTEKVGSRWLAGSLGAAILLPNVLAGFGWIVMILFAVLIFGALFLSVSPLLSSKLNASRATTTDPISSAPIIAPLNDSPLDEIPTTKTSVDAPHEFRPAYLVLGALLFGTALLTLARILGGKTGYAPLVELSKILLILFTARLCSDNDLFLGEGWRDLPTRSRWELFGCWSAAMLLAFLSDDLGFLLSLWIPFTLLLSLSIGRRWPVIIGLVGLIAGAATLAMSGHTRFPERVSAWLNPWSAPSSQMAEAFQRMASVPSVIAGTGIGRGAPLTISTDSRDLILPLYYENLGWAGLALVIALLLLGIHRVFRVGLRARNSYSQWLALGFGCFFAVQTVYMIGASFGAWPLTGMTLAPLASGKAAAFFTLAMAILALAASSTQTRNAAPDRKERARFVSTAFAIFAILSLGSLAKAAKTLVFQKDAIAIHPFNGMRNRRALAELSSLRTGRIMARKTGLNYGSVNLTPIAYSIRDAEDQEARRYPLGDAAFPVSGVLAKGHLTGGEEEWRSQLTGLDAFFDEGRPGVSPDAPKDLQLLDLWQRKNHPLWPREDRIDPQDVQTTINADMQRWAFDALKGHLQNSRSPSGDRPRKGSMLIADLRTGEVLAYAQYPAPNPEPLAKSWRAWEEIDNATSGYFDANGNLLDWVRDTDRAPGSTAKINTMMALSEAGMANRKFTCKPGITVNGYVIRDHDNGVHGRVGLREILKYSCNRGAAQAAGAVGSDALLAIYKKLRYPLPHMHQPETSFRRYYELIAFGQAMSGSLWDLATSVSTVARGGEAIQLHLLKRPPESVEKWRVCSQDTANRVADGMKAVTEPGGTAWTVYRGSRDWPSKTGSAEVDGQKETDAWFVGYAPRRAPALAFVVWAEADGTGGGLAKSIQLPDLIDKCLRSIGIVDAPLARPLPRARAPILPQTPENPIGKAFAETGLKMGHAIMKNIQEGVRRGLGEITKNLEQLRNLKKKSDSTN